MPYFSPGILGPQVALDFSRLTEDAQDVSLDLSSDGEILGGYQNMTILTESGEQRRFIDVLVGGPGNDLLIGNDGNNLLLGRDGSDTLVGNGGNDQLNANRDFSPDVDNAPNGVDDRYDLDDDLTLFGAQVITFSNQSGISATS